MPFAVTPFGRAAAFYAIAFGLALLVALFGQSLGEATPLISMFTPLAAVLIMKVVVVRDGYRLVGWRDLGLHRAAIWFWPIAIVLPAVALLPGYAVVWGTDVANFVSPPVDGMFKTLFKFVAGILFAAALTGLGEETGWRSYLQPNLMALGPMTATLLTGFLHGAWHLPLMLLTPFYHQAGERLIVIVLFMAALTIAGPIYGWFRLASGSLWPVAILHASFNDWWEVFDGATASKSTTMVEYVAGESGIVAIAAYVAIALLLWFHPSFRARIAAAPGKTA